MTLETLLIETSMTIYILSEPISIIKILGKNKISQNILAILALILKSGIVHGNLLCNEMCHDVAMSKQWPGNMCFCIMIRGTSTDFTKYME